MKPILSACLIPAVVPAEARKKNTSVAPSCR